MKNKLKKKREEKKNNTRTTSKNGKRIKHDNI